METETRKAAMREYARKNKDKFREYRKKYRQKLKSKFIELYGGKCSCCGDDRVEFLTLDHVEGDGALRRNNNGRRKSGQRSRDNLQEYIKANKAYDPDTFQILCMNCNCGKQWYGECPCRNYPNLFPQS